MLLCLEFQHSAGQRFPPPPQPWWLKEPFSWSWIPALGLEGAFYCKGVLAAGSGWMEIFNLLWNAACERVSASQKQSWDTHLCSYFESVWHLEDRC